MVFVHHARTPADIIFREELRLIESEHPGVRVVVVCEDDSTDERWTGPRGRVTLPMLLDVAPDLVDREVFTCGPAPYMEAVRTTARPRSAPTRTRCHEESFDLATTAAAPERLSRRRPVRRTRSSCGAAARTLECDEDTTLLAAAAQAGLSLPRRARRGCAARARPRCSPGGST